MVLAISNPAYTIGQSQTIDHALGVITATQTQCYTYELTWKGVWIGNLERDSEGFWCGVGQAVALPEAAHITLIRYLDVLRVRRPECSREEIAARF